MRKEGKQSSESLASQKVKKAELVQEAATPIEALPISVICPFCKAPFGKEKIVRCSVCGTRHHAACWNEHGRCSLYNCPGKKELIISGRKFAGVVTAAAIMIFGGLYLLIGSRSIHEFPPPSAPIPERATPSRVLRPSKCGSNVELLEAARSGQTQRLANLVQSGGNVNGSGTVSIFSENDRCLTPLMVAAYYGQTATASLLIQSGASSNDADEFGFTVLMFSIIGNHPDVVETLLKAGASPSIKNRYGDTSLNLAAIRGNPRILHLLIAAGADPNIANELGYTPLIQALRAKQFEMARILITSGASMNQTDSAGRTPLSWSCEQGDEPTVKALLEAHADPNLKDAKGLTPLIWATKANHAAIAKMLIQSGADLSATDAAGKTALDYAKQAQLSEIEHVLLKTRVP
ncbi:ankyrin repeat domain-containing protein [bacterium]|nr:ankyrin repeat domain-containing protein [bacterium]